MWQYVTDSFRDSPKQLRVAQALIQHGFRVDGPGVIKCRQVRIPLVALGEALNVDRRTVYATTKRIHSDERLRLLFSSIEPIGSSHEKMARMMGHGVVVIHVESPQRAGVVAEVTSVIASHGIAIRQIVAEDVGVYEEPSLRVVVESALPGSVISALASIRGVKKVAIER
ncbi:MAG: hypothetical protein QXS20_08800 [Candidatus Thorarchaeota archaeon]